MAPAHSFAKLCTSAKIAIPPKPQHLQFLTDAGILSVNAPAKEVHERCAALAWARASLAAATDPDTWSSALDASLHPVLLGLYPLPPHRGADAPPSDFQRLAATIKLYDPNPPAAAPAPSPAPPPLNTASTDGLDIGRPGNRGPARDIGRDDATEFLGRIAHRINPKACQFFFHILFF